MLKVGNEEKKNKSVKFKDPFINPITEPIRPSVLVF